MSTQVVSPSATPPARPLPTRPSAQIRLATVQHRLKLATDALSAAAILLGVNRSAASVAEKADAPVQASR